MESARWHEEKLKQYCSDNVVVQWTAPQKWELFCLFQELSLDNHQKQADKRVKRSWLKSLHCKVSDVFLNKTTKDNSNISNRSEEEF